MFVCDGCLIAIGLLLFGIIYMYVGACLQRHWYLTRACTLIMLYAKSILEVS